MALTPNQRSRDPSKFPTTQLFLLSLARISEPIALTSIFPYAWSLVRSYNIGTENDAAFYAGILIAAFSLAEAVTGVFWGGVSDRIGRKPVLLIGTGGTLLSLLIVGFASNFWTALLGRIVGGLLNGNIGVIQTMVGEITTNPKHEPRAFAVMPFVWSIGTILGPALGGFFSEPARTWPEVFPSGGLFGRQPYLLPNLICAFLQLFSILAAYLWLVETHPDMQVWSTRDDLKYTTAETPLISTTGAISSAPANISQEAYGTFDHVEIREIAPRKAKKEWKRNLSSDSVQTLGSISCEKAFTKPVIMLVAALGIFTYHSMTYDHLLPIFLQDSRTSIGPHSLPKHFILSGGLGLSIQDVGMVMAFNGIIALFVQGLIFPFLASVMGIWPLFCAVTVAHPIAYLLVPNLLILPQQYLNMGIYVSLFVRNLFSILVYPLLLILIKEAAPSTTHLGRINGLAASTGAACRTLASPIAGILYGVGARHQFAPLPWIVSALVASIGACQLLWLKRPADKTAMVRSAAAFCDTGSERVARESSTASTDAETEQGCISLAHDLC